MICTASSTVCVKLGPQLPKILMPSGGEFRIAFTSIRGCLQQQEMIHWRTLPVRCSTRFATELFSSEARHQICSGESRSRHS